MTNNSELLTPAADEKTVLGHKDSKTFAEALENPPEPNERLVAAFATDGSPCKLCDGEGFTYEPEYYADGTLSRTVTQVPCSCSAVVTDGKREAFESARKHHDTLERYRTNYGYTVERWQREWVLFSEGWQAAKASNDVPKYTREELEGLITKVWAKSKSDPNDDYMAGQAINALIEAGALQVKE
ncbi:MAG: DUF1778 domain-containing protein [Caulobacteraceae bacterium]|nr:DUF1778 domain-containing protein [Caulobacteraceae bacterium]